MDIRYAGSYVNPERLTSPNTIFTAYAERCTSYSKSVRLSVTHWHCQNDLLTLRSCGLHCWIAPWLCFSSRL